MSFSSQKPKWILIGLLLISLVMPAMAISDIVGTGGSVNTTTKLQANVGTFTNVSGLHFDKIEDFTGLSAVVVSTTYATASKVSDSINVDLYAGNTVVGGGLLGYNYDGVTLTYTVFFIPTSINFGTLTGIHNINFTPLVADPHAWNLSGLKIKGTGDATVDYIVYFQGVLGGGFTSRDSMVGSYITNRLSTFYNAYDFLPVTPPVYRVNVSKQVSGSMYSSRVFVSSGSTLLASETVFGTTSYNGTFYQLPIQISILDKYARWWNTSSMGLGTLAYNISLTPTNISTTESSSGTITSTSDPWLASITAVSWSWSDSTGGAIFSDGLGTGNLTQYTKTGTTWYGYNLSSNSFNVNKGTGIPNPVALYGSVMGGTGAKTITCLIATSDGNYYTLTATLTVGGAEGYVPTYAGAVDYSTGAFVSDATIGFRNVATGVWYSNVTVGGQNSINSPPGIYLDIQATAPGYAPVTRYSVTASQVNQSPMYYELGMFPVSAITGANQTTFYVTVHDQSTGWGISGSTVLVSNASFSWQKTTASNGIATFLVYNQTLYQVTATKSGFSPQTKFVTVLSGTVATTDMYLSPISTVIPTSPTYTTVTTVPSGVPTPVGGNYTGIWGPFYNAATAMGAKPMELQLLMACFFVALGAIVGGFGFSGGQYSGVGAEAGGMMAFVLACAFGFISVLWIVCLFVWLAFRYFLLRQ